jgi:poly(3-hydroxybutyrate) depolymerase
MWSRRKRTGASSSCRSCSAIRIALLLTLLGGLAHAKPAPPCDRCVLDVPAKTDHDVPMLVVLHGDREHATDVAARWRAAAKASGWVLLALEVPEGDSWWQWGGDPNWVIARADKVIADAHVDPARVYLAGWSGGATYIGDHVQAWEPVFGGVVIHGGGRAPVDGACVKRLPAFFLVGSGNKLHPLAVALRKYLAGCKQQIVWDVVEHGGHEAERKALTKKKAMAILTWLAREKR